MNLLKSLIPLLALVPCFATAQNTTKLTSSKANDFGIAYSLPVTVFDIVIETETTQKEPGEFSNYANRYLNANDAITRPSYQSRIKSVTVVPKGQPNEDSRWLTEFKGITYMMLDEAGVPISINTEQVDIPAPVALPTPQKAEPTPLETPAAKQAITQEMTASTSTSKRAQLAAQRIFELRERRNDLISGDADNTPPDGKSMQLMLDNLTAQEAALTAMFVGTERTSTEVHTLSFTPDAEDVTDMVIARLSPKGLVDADDLSGSPIYLSTETITTGDIPTDANGAPKKAVKDGLAYNIPGSLQLTLTCDGKTLVSRDYEVAQLGKVFYLDPKIFTDKKAPSFVKFNPVTGGILTIGTFTPTKE